MPDSVLDFPISKPVTTGGAGAHAPVDTYTTKIPGYGGVPAQQAAIEMGNAEQAQKIAATDVAQAGIDTAQATEQGAQQQVPIADEYSKAVGDMMEASRLRREKVEGAYDRASSEAASKHYVNHWQDQSTGTKVLAAISSFLGGYATGTPVSRAQEWVDRDYHNQKEEMARLWKVAEARGADQEHLAALEESGLRHLQAGYIGKLESVKRQVDYEMAKKGTAQARANGEKLKADLDVTIAKTREQMAKDTEIQAMTHTRKALGAQNIQTRKLPDGRVIWKNPGDGLWHEMLKPNPTPAAAPVAVPAGVAAPPPAPAAAPPPAAAPTYAPGTGIAGLNVNAAAQGLANVGRR